MNTNSAVLHHLVATGWPEAPQSFYKYLPKKYAKRMLSFGEIFINTLYDCRRKEHNEMRRDAGEGTLTRYIDEPLSINQASDVPPSLRHLIHVEDGPDEGFSPPGSGVTFSNVSFVHSDPDMYLYCVSEVLDEQLMRDFRCDACVRIDDPATFFLALSLALRFDATLVSLGGCVYQSRLVHHSSPSPSMPSYVIKDPFFGRQREARAVWEPTIRPIKPFPILCWNAARVCTRVI